MNFEKGKLYQLELSRLTPDPEQPRKYLDPATLAELQASIAMSNKPQRFTHEKKCFTLCPYQFYCPRFRLHQPQTGGLQTRKHSENSIENLKFKRTVFKLPQ